MTVAENIAYGQEMNREAVIMAARAAYAHDFIMELPDGYDTVVGEKARNSGQQRLTIRHHENPSLLILTRPPRLWTPSPSASYSRL